MSVVLNVCISAITAWVVTAWVTKRRFDRIDRYVEETTQALKDAAERLGLTVGDADINESTTERR